MFATVPERSKVHWKITLLETAVIVTIAVVVSLLVGGSAEFLFRSFEFRHKRGAHAVALLMSIRDVNLQGARGDFTLSSKTGKIVSSSSRIRAVRTKLKIN